MADREIADIQNEALDKIAGETVEAPLMGGVAMRREKPLPEDFHLQRPGGGIQPSPRRHVAPPPEQFDEIEMMFYNALAVDWQLFVDLITRELDAMTTLSRRFREDGSHFRDHVAQTLCDPHCDKLVEVRDLILAKKFPTRER